MLNRLVSTVLLGFALLLAQQGAVWHSLSHLREAPAPSQQDKQLPHSETCAQCLAFAHIGGAVTSSFPPFVLPAAAPAQSIAVRLVFRATHRPQYRSRAPPVLA
jgi:hypothetical protein